MGIARKDVDGLFSWHMREQGGPVSPELKEVGEFFRSFVLLLQDLFYRFKYLFIYLFLAALGLRCGVQASH